MKFSDIQGNEEIKRVLVDMIECGRVPHALMLHEDEGSGAFSIVLAFLQYLFCHSKEKDESFGDESKISKLIHPDIHFVFPLNSGLKVTGKIDDLRPSQFMEYFRELVLTNPDFTESDLYEALGIEGKTGIISTGSAKDIIEKLSLTSLEGGYTAVVVWLPEKLNISAANRLLKIIEEPPASTFFIMITHEPEKVLPTISSRCLRLRVMPKQTSVVRSDYEENFALFKNLITALNTGKLSLVLEVSEQLASLESREKQKAFCKFAEECLRKIFLVQQNLSQLAYMTEEEKEYYLKISGKCKKNFPRNAMEVFDRTNLLIGRNVNQKILFCDMADRLYSIV